MNYYNPYMMTMPLQTAATTTSRAGLFSGLINGIRGIKWGSVVNNTQRTLGLINQAIPVVKQVSPVMKNVKTMFKVMNEFKKVDTPSVINNNVNSNSSNIVDNKNEYKSVSNKKETNNYNTPTTNKTNEPTFFI